MFPKPHYENNQLATELTRSCDSSIEPKPSKRPKTSHQTERQNITISNHHSTNGSSNTEVNAAISIHQSSNPFHSNDSIQPVVQQSSNNPETVGIQSNSTRSEGLQSYTTFQSNSHLSTITQTNQLRHNRVVSHSNNQRDGFLLQSQSLVGQLNPPSNNQSINQQSWHSFNAPASASLFSNNQSINSPDVMPLFTPIFEADQDALSRHIAQTTASHEAAHHYSPFSMMQQVMLNPVPALFASPPLHPPLPSHQELKYQAEIDALKQDVIAQSNVINNLQSQLAALKKDLHVKNQTLDQLVEENRKLDEEKRKLMDSQKEQTVLLNRLQAGKRQSETKARNTQIRNEAAEVERKKKILDSIAELGGKPGVRWTQREAEVLIQMVKTIQYYDASVSETAACVRIAHTCRRSESDLKHMLKVWRETGKVLWSKLGN